MHRVRPGVCAEAEELNRLVRERGPSPAEDSGIRARAGSGHSAADCAGAVGPRFHVDTEMDRAIMVQVRTAR